MRDTKPAARQRSALRIGLAAAGLGLVLVACNYTPIQMPFSDLRTSGGDQAMGKDAGSTSPDSSFQIDSNPSPFCDGGSKDRVMLKDGFRDTTSGDRLVGEGGISDWGVGEKGVSEKGVSEAGANDAKPSDDSTKPD